MNDFRWILLLLGLVFIVLIYLWGSRKSSPPARVYLDKALRRRRKAPPQPNMREETLAEMDEFLLSRSLREQPERGAGTAQQPLRAGQNAANGRRHLLSLLIKAPPARLFAGADIFDAAQAAGMQFGYMSIFHYHGPSNGHTLFSLANMYEPGRFEPQCPQPTKGLILFMQLPLSWDDPEAAFELFRDTATKLADVLGGAVHDAQHQPLDEQGLRALRDKLLRFDDGASSND